MKKPLILAMLIGILAASCSSDSPGNDTASNNNFLPLTVGNFWKYDVVGTGISTRDSLFVANDTMIGTDTYKKMKTLALPLGFYSTSLNKNAIRKVNSSLVVKGTAGFNFGGLLPLNMTLNDFVVFRENATDGDQLSTVTGEATQDVQGYPLTLQYTLKSTAGETLPTYTAPNGTAYTDVKVVHVALNLAIVTTISVAGFNVDVPILASQDVVMSNQYFAKNIGMVYAATTISYNLEDLTSAGITLPIPSSMNEVQTETLAGYQAD